MSDHERYQKVAAAALDFPVSAADSAALAGHLRVCSECRRFAAGIAADDASARARSRVHAPERVRTRIRTAAVRPGSRRGFRSALPAIGSVAVAIALLAGLGWLGRTRSDLPGREAPSAEAPLTWTELSRLPAFDGASVSDVTTTGAQLIAVGVRSEGGRHIATMWRSQDALAWTRLPDDPSFIDAAAGRVVVAGSTVVVVGSVAAPKGEPGVGRTAVWLSKGLLSCDTCSAPPSGDPWRGAETAFPRQADPATVFYAVAAGRGAFVLVGGVVSHPAAGDVPLRAAVATSIDGSRWTMEDTTSPAFDQGSMRSVAWGPSGFVGVGMTALAPTAWISADGRTWEREANPIGPATASIRAVAAGPSGYVAVGDDGTTGAAWASTDGRAWTPSPDRTPFAGARVYNVVRLASEFVATGETSAGDGATWTSRDGVTWSRLDPGPAFHGTAIRAASSLGSRIVLFGVDASDHVIAAAGAPYQP